MLRKTSLVAVLLLCTCLCMAQVSASHINTLEILLKHNDSAYNAQYSMALSNVEKIYGVPQIDNDIQQNMHHIIFINAVMLGIGSAFIIFVLTLVLYSKRRVTIKWHY